ncbi:glycerol transporter [Pleurotus pulmonarius]|nr:glycerol transporter [Pleurotus pulmonarius]
MTPGVTNEVELESFLPQPHALNYFEHRDHKNMGIVGLTVDIPSSRRSDTRTDRKQSPSRWKTVEFRCYVAIACIVVPIMFWIPMTLSRSTHPNYPLYAPRLSQGWMFGRKVDNSDDQYRSFRTNIPSLSAAALIYLTLKSLYVRVAGTSKPDSTHLIPFNLAFSILMLLALHGSSILKILLILTINFAIAKYCGPSKLAPWLIWTFNGAILLANDRYHGYVFGDILPALSFLDEWDGLYPRWYISFNITMLRLVSFGMDYHWACKHPGKLDIDSNLNEKTRVSTVHSLEMYSFINYLSYAIYSPLYIAGPIMTFNDYLWQHRKPMSITWRYTLGYLLRFLVSLLTMEFILHFLYVVAIKNKKAWGGDTPAEISMIGFWNLVIVWLKLLIPWRFFRLWALLDNIDPPENMVRCMANNYSTFGFWRSWHRSYNLWIIRYIYIPMGGAKSVVLNSVLVFTFVALWHDLTFRLLAWGWLVSLFIIPELLASSVLPASKYDQNWWYRHVCALGAVGNIMMMMAANLVGFVIGTDGVQFFLQRLTGSIEGTRFLVFSVFCLFVAAHLMFEYREEEMRHGIYRRC